jgi:hypothetical protein
MIPLPFPTTQAQQRRSPKLLAEIDIWVRRKNVGIFPYARVRSAANIDQGVYDLVRLLVKTPPGARRLLEYWELLDLVKTAERLYE